MPVDCEESWASSAVLPGEIKGAPGGVFSVSADRAARAPSRVPPAKIETAATESFSLIGRLHNRPKETR